MRLYAAIALVALAASVASAQSWGGRPWNDLSPEEQERAWQNYRRYRKLPQEQQRLRDTYQRYRGLPREQRREFTEKYRRWREKR